MSTLSQITENKIVAILRGVPSAQIVDVAQALHAGGIRVLEITMNSEEPLTAIRKVTEVFGDGMVIGAGTVLDTAMAKAAIAAGAKFVLSPIVERDVINVTKDLGAVSIPGAYTPTEIYSAFQWGADLIKVFPATSPGYIRELSGPLPQVPLLPTGGITPQNINDYKEAGAVGFGIGSALVNAKQPLTAQSLETITEKARQFVAAIAKR
ncbi:bifunctional 4-hydroxy-2-oxoglutarate aldolase/2-dehydro-3-deoxy-phosphogluconate aldolase [Parapedobacter sp. GCM10030251]|uniref:bifunctional 4-hydroxy-2-oxoglutarate aldolase/2-dehydro-3-deoxy-phosphogluconate aldolase n=1 Tax=Parapedobacter sp. GCM10030251 TaxID=3273419 RepID=UPI00361B0CA9